MLLPITSFLWVFWLDCTLVIIYPELKSRQANREALNELIKLYGNKFFGGKLLIFYGTKSLYTARALPFKSEEFAVRFADIKKKEKERAVRKYTITIQLAGRTDMYNIMQLLLGRQRDTPQGITQVLDVVLGESALLNYVSLSTDFSTTFYCWRAEVFKCWRGYYQNPHPLVTIDECTRSFFKAVRTINFVEKLLDVPDSTRPLSYGDAVKIKKTLQGIYIETCHQQDRIRRYKITGITPVPMRQLILPFDNKRSQKTAVQYFWEKYGYGLAYSSWPCLQVGGGCCLAYLPMEVCYIVEEQRYIKKQLNERQATYIRRATCKLSRDRKQSIHNMVLPNGPTDLNQASMPTTNLDADVESYLQGEASESSVVTVFVCVYDEQIPVPVNLRKSTVLDVVRAALFKRKIKVQDACLYLERRNLDGNEILSSLPLGRDSHIRLGPRTRGGVPFIINQPVHYESLNTVLANNAFALFDIVLPPPELMITGDQHPAFMPIYFWSGFTCYLMHRLFVLVFWDGHLHGRCYGGRFTSANIGVTADGQLKINVESENYYPDGGRADCNAMITLIHELLLIPFTHGYPVHVEFLVTLLSNHAVHLWANRNFLTFLVNYPSLLSHADKYKWYTMIDLKILQLDRDQLDILRQIFTNPIFQGWQTYISHVPAFNDTFMYRAQFDSNAQAYVSVYTPHLDQAFHFGRNFLSHPPAEITQEVAEAALSYLLDHLLAIFVLALVIDFVGPQGWKWELMGIISNSNSDKSKFN